MSSRSAFFPLLAAAIALVVIASILVSLLMMDLMQPAKHIMSSSALLATVLMVMAPL